MQTLTLSILSILLFFAFTPEIQAQEENPRRGTITLKKPDTLYNTTVRDFLTDTLIIYRLPYFHGLACGGSCIFRNEPSFYIQPGYSRGNQQGNIELLAGRYIGRSRELDLYVQSAINPHNKNRSFSINTSFHTHKTDILSLFRFSAGYMLEKNLNENLSAINPGVTLSLPSRVLHGVNFRYQYLHYTNKEHRQIFTPSKLSLFYEIPLN